MCSCRAGGQLPPTCVATGDLSVAPDLRNNFSIAPLSVVVDPIRALRVFGLESGGQFSEKVLYIYRKQLERGGHPSRQPNAIADATRNAPCRDKLTSIPRAEIVEVSARQGEGWIMVHSPYRRPKVARAVMELDLPFMRRASPGLALGLNCTAQLDARNAFRPNAVLKRLANRFRRASARGAEVAHLKMTFSSEESLVGSR